MSSNENERVAGEGHRISKLKNDKALSSSIFETRHRSQLVQLCRDCTVSGAYLYYSDFRPTQLDQLTPGGPYVYLQRLVFAILYCLSTMGRGVPMAQNLDDADIILSHSLHRTKKIRLKFSC